MILSTLLSFSVFSQDFEGKIIYQYSYKSKVPKVTDDDLLHAMGTTSEYFIKDGNYKSIPNGNTCLWSLYINKENKVYTKLSGVDAILWVDASKNDDKVLKAEINKGVTTIAGYLCDELVLKCRTGVQKIYFSSKVSVNVKLFEKHKYNNWYDILSRTNALPLKYIIENEQFIAEGTALAVIERKITDSTFVLPPNVKTKRII